MITRVLLGAATRRRDILLCFHPAFPLQLPPLFPLLSSRLHQSHPVLNIASTNVRLFFYFCSFFLFLSFLFFIDGGTDGVRTCFLFFINCTCIVHGVSRRNKCWRRSVRKRESLEMLEFFVRLSAIVLRYTQCIRLFVLIKIIYIIFLLLYVLYI